MDSVEKIQRAVEHPEQFIGLLVAASAPLARNSALAIAWSWIELWLKKQGISWNVVLPILETIDSVEEIQQAVGNPEEFLANW